MHTMDTRLDQATRQSCQGITCVDRDGPILRTHPLPLAFGVKDLECCDGLAEKKSHCSQVCMTGTVQIADFLVLFWTAGCVVHVAEVIFALGVVLMVADQLVFVWEMEEDGEETEKFLDYFCVAFLYLLVWFHQIFEYMDGIPG